MRPLLPLIAALAVGCSDAEDGRAAWLQGAGYGWDLFNHRVSYLSLGVDDDGAWASAVGGTSTTMQGAELPEGCVADDCKEFPFLDRADVDVHWVEVAARGAVAGTGRASLLAGADGATTELVVDLPRRARGEPVAMLSGFTLDTDRPLSGGDACYDPEFGWLPRRIALSLGAPTLSDDGTQVFLDVSAAFEAGRTLEDERRCLDAVVEQAQVGVEAFVTVLVTRQEHEAVDVAHGLVYPYGEGGRSDPDVQPPPPDAERPLDHGIDGPVATGWSALDYRFHVDDPDLRGAYVRTLAFDADPERNLASGHATNYSPGTQLSGFDYAFSGTVQVVRIRGDIATGTASEQLDVTLDDAGDPVVWEIGR